MPNLYQQTPLPRPLADLTLPRRAGGAAPWLYQNDFFGPWYAGIANLLFADFLGRRRGAAQNGDALEVGGSYTLNTPGMSYALGAGAYGTGDFSRYVVPCASAPQTLEATVRIGANPTADGTFTLEFRFTSYTDTLGVDFTRGEIALFRRTPSGTLGIATYTRPQWWSANSLERYTVVDDGLNVSVQLNGVEVIPPTSVAQGQGNTNVALALYTGGAWQDLWLERWYGTGQTDTTPPASQMFLLGG